MITAVATDLINRAKQDYFEMPGLLLTTRQASRLWNIDSGVCHDVLSALVREQFLFETSGGAYLRRDAGRSAARLDEHPARLAWPDVSGDGRER